MRHIRQSFTTRVMQQQTLSVYDALIGSTLSRAFERSRSDATTAHHSDHTER
jgi:hypothetical protein